MTFRCEKSLFDLAHFLFLSSVLGVGLSIPMIAPNNKVLEIRGTRLREGDIWLGNNGIVFGKARLGKAKRIRTTKDWQELRHLHLVADDALPYKKPWGLPLSSVIRLREAVPFVHRRGAIGIARFRPP